MPTYEYVCRNCGHRFDIVQSIHDDPLTVCPNCGESQLRKVFAPPAIAFKGSGFYATDSRSASREDATAGKRESASETAAKDGSKDRPKDGKESAPKGGAERPASGSPAGDASSGSRGGSSEDRRGSPKRRESPKEDSS
jgi:putative FmdB family regulatory protein